MDSVLILDSFIVEGLRIDTVLSLETLIDTAYIVKDNVTIKIVRINDSIYVDAEVKEKIVYRSRWKTRTIVVKRPIDRQKSFVQRLEDWFIRIAIGVLIFILLFKNAKNNK